MSKILDLSNWRETVKKASTQVQDDREVEEAFMRQASTFVQNKARPIYKAPYLLGFEIVHKADDSNTRMVGIFAFKVESDLYYAPAFFINGEIKGTDLFYSHSQKLFYPLTTDWVKYLINFSEGDEGKAIGKDQTNKVPKQINLRDVAHPPFNTKAASEAWSEMTKVASEIVKKAKEKNVSILKNFILDAGPESLNWLGDFCEHSEKFANALYSLVDENSYLVDPTEFTNVVKKASENKPEDELVLHLGRFNPNNVKVAMDVQLKKGYTFEDNRSSAGIDYIVEDKEQCFEAANVPGLYEVPTISGSLREYVIIPGCEKYLKRNYEIGNSDYGDLAPCYPEPEYSGYTKAYYKEGGYLIFDPKEKSIGVKNKNRFLDFDSISGIMQKGITEIWDSEYMKEKPEKGKVYIVYDKKEAKFSKPVYIIDSEEIDGVNEYKFSDYLTDREDGSLFVNPDLEKSDWDRNVFTPHCCRFIEVDFEKPSTEYDCFEVKKLSDFPASEKEAFGAMLEGRSYKKASVIKSAHGWIIKDGPKNCTPELNEVGVKAQLMLGCNIREETADEILKRAAEDREFHFFYFPESVDGVKNASQLVINDAPEFYMGYNSDYNVAEQIPETHVLKGRSVSEQEPPHRVGDVWQSGSGINIDISTATPESLAKLADETGETNIFEHGVVGSLAKTYNANHLIDKYLPDLQQSLDKIGRMLFLIYWKPEDFAESYGSDDNAEIENMLVSNFKSMGDMVLELIRKNNVQN